MPNVQAAFPRAAFSRFFSLEARPEVERKRPAVRDLIERLHRVELEDDTGGDQTDARARAVEQRRARA